LILEACPAQPNAMKRALRISLDFLALYAVGFLDLAVVEQLPQTDKGHGRTPVDEMRQRSNQIVVGKAGD
jgi:hypothetical protein